MRVSYWFGVAKTVARVTYESDIRFIATTLAYYTFLSFVPLLLLVFAVVGQRLAVGVVARPARFVTPAAQELLFQALTTASGRTGATVLSVAVLGWGGANVAVGFLTAVERIEGVGERSLLLQLRDSVTVLGTLAVAMLAILVQTVVLAVISASALETVVGTVALGAVLTVVFVPLYYVPSRLVDSLPAALPGALTTAFGWSVIHAGIQFYALNAAQYAVYGVLSGIILILTTIYLAGVVLMMGLVVNATLAAERTKRLPANV
jgi:membrane protein